MKKILIFSIIVYIVFLTTFYNASFMDETDWITAGYSFKNALLNLSPKDTYVGYMSLHPGVTVLWISSIIQILFPNLTLAHIIIIHRLVFLIIGVILTLVSAKLLFKSIQQIKLVIIFFYLLLEPHFIINGGLSWLDFLLIFLMALTLLVWIRFLSSGNKIDILKTGILMGLTILTKFMGIYLIPMLLTVTVLHSKVKSVASGKFLKSLLGVFCVSLITFIILYPAMWVNPKRTLLSRFDKQEARHEISLSESESVLSILPKKIAEVNPVILLSIPLLIIKLYSKQKSSSIFLFLGLGGFIYALCLISTLLVIVDKGRGPYIFLASLGRYLLPSIPLIGLFFFHEVFQTKSINKFFKASTVFLLFAWEILKLFFP